MLKNDLIFRKPLMNAAGFLGFAPDPRAALSWDAFGAFVTNPISWRPRVPAANPALQPYPGGFLLHSGWPNPGFSAVLKKCARRWAVADLAVIPHLMVDSPEQAARMVRSLEGLENIAAIELGFAPVLAGDTLRLAIQMCLGELPLIANLPFEQVLTLGPQLTGLGAAAISIAAPRGALVAHGSAEPGQLFSGRLYGPALFPQSLVLVRDAARLGLPILGGVGVYDRDDAFAMLESGALAVQLDAVLWKNGGITMHQAVPGS